MGGKVLELESDKLIQRGIEQGLKKGIQQGIAMERKKYRACTSQGRGGDSTFEEAFGRTK